MSATSPVNGMGRDASVATRRYGRMDRSDVGYCNNGNYWGKVIMGFIALWVFIWVLLFTFRPSWLFCDNGRGKCGDRSDKECDDVRRGDELDLTKLLWTSFVVTAFVAIIIYFITCSKSCD